MYEMSALRTRLAMLLQIRIPLFGLFGVRWVVLHPLYKDSWVCEWITHRGIVSVYRLVPK